MKSRVTQRSNQTFTTAEPPIEEMLALLQEARNVLVASHIDPDGDALGTQLAFAAYLRSEGKQVTLIREAGIPEKYLFMHGIGQIPCIDDYHGAQPFDTAVILECPNVKRIGRASQLLTENTVILSIDHHRDNDEFGAINWINTKASSVGEMVYEFFERVRFTINSHIAEQLYTAILTDTGRFRFSSTSGRTMEIGGKLIEAGANPQEICDRVYFNMSPATIKLVGKVLNGIRFYKDEQVCVISLTREMLDESGAKDSDSEGLVDYTLFTGGVKAGMLLKEIEPKVTKASLRSRNNINVSAIAARFGGGGHFNASGCTLNLGLEDARKELVKILSEVIDEQDG